MKKNSNPNCDFKKPLKPKIGYKALYPSAYSQTSTLKSWSAPIPTEYKFNEWTIRPENCGPLALFKYKYQAIAFVKKHSISRHIRKISRHIVFKCQYIQSNDKLLWNKTSSLKKNQIPKTTIFADKIKILKPLKGEI